MSQRRWAQGCLGTQRAIPEGADFCSLNYQRPTSWQTLDLALMSDSGYLLQATLQFPSSGSAFLAVRRVLMRICRHNSHCTGQPA